METTFDKLRPLDRFTIPGPNPEVVYTKLSPRTYRDGTDWVYEVGAQRRAEMVVVRVAS